MFKIALLSLFVGGSAFGAAAPSSVSGIQAPKVTVSGDPGTVFTVTWTGGFKSVETLLGAGNVTTATGFLAVQSAINTLAVNTATGFLAIQSAIQAESALTRSVSNTGWQVFPTEYVTFSTTDNGAWHDTRGNNSALFYVEIATGGGKSATLIVTTTSTVTGASVANETHGLQVGANIVQSGIYTFSPVGTFTKIRINATNGATCSVGSTFKW